MPHELGTCFLVNNYQRVKQLVRRYGLRPDIPARGRAVYLDAGPSDSDPPDLGPFLRKTVQEEWRRRNPKSKAHPAIVAPASVLHAILRYGRIYRALLGSFKLPYGMPLSLPPHVLERIDMTFLEFLRQNQLDALTPALRIAQVAQGYGYIENIPAYYGLCWTAPAFLAGFVLQAMGLAETTRMLPDGFEALWRTIAEKDALSIRPNAQIHAIDRQGANGTVRVDYSLEGERRRATYDFLILAFDLRHALPLLRDATETERRLFGALEAFTVTATLYESDPMPGYSTIGHDKAAAYYVDVLSPGNDHEWYADRHDAQVFAGINGVRRRFDRQLRVAYQFSEHETPADEPCGTTFGRNAAIAAKLGEGWRRRGIGNPRILEQCSWPYFTHFPGWAIRRGYLNELFAYQGAHRTWYAGASACFESVNHVVNYNHALIDTYL